MVLPAGLGKEQHSDPQLNKPRTNLERRTFAFFPPALTTPADAIRAA